MAIITGTAGNDTIVPGNFNGANVDLSGSDDIDGLGGNDTIDGGSGRDIVRGGDGDDVLNGGSGGIGPFALGDSLLGERGNDTLDGGVDTEADSLDGGAEDDVLIVRDRDRADGSLGNDEFRLTGPVGAATTLTDFQGSDRLLASGDISQASISGIERLVTSGTVTLSTLQILDFATIDAGGGSSVTLNLADASRPLNLGNPFAASVATVNLRGAAGDDLIALASAATARIFYGSAAAGTGTGADNVTTGAGRDRVFGEDGDDTLNGAGGDDEIGGGAGNDTADAGAGRDTVNGDGGADILDGGDDLDRDSIRGGDGNDLIRVRVDDDLGGNAGGDRFRYENAGVAFGAAVDGGTDSDTLVGFGDITSLTLTSVERLVTTAPVTLRRAQLDGFSVIGEAANPSVSLRLADTSATPLNLAGRFDPAVTAVSLLGSAGNDLVTTGGSFTAVLQYGNVTAGTGTGSDQVTSGSGNDRLHGEDGDDTLNAAAGNDTVDGGSGTDIVDGGLGNDTVSGGTGNDTVRGGDGNDTLDGDAADATFVPSVTFGADILEGGAGDDLISAGPGDTARGGSGNDSLRARVAAPLALDGGTGTDVVLVQDIAPLAPGPAPTDMDLAAGTITGIERLLTNVAARVTSAQLNSFTALGGTFAPTGVAYPEVKLVLADATQAINLAGDLDPSVTSLVITGSSGNEVVATGAGFAGTVRFVGNASGTGSGNDRIESGAGNDRLDGQDGNDILIGNGGNDTLIAGSGADGLTGGDGDDRLEIAGDATWTNPSIVALHRDMARSVDSRFDFTRIEGKLQVHDVLRGGGGTDSVVGTAGADVVLRLSDDAPIAVGGTANTRVSGVERFELGDGDDVLSVYGDTTGATVLGGNGKDILWSGFANDTLEGGDGADYLVGGRGDDLLRGNLAGNVGDGDRDLYGFGDHPGAGNDRIEGFEDGIDQIRVVGFNVTSVTSPGIVIQQVGADTRITLTDANVAVVTLVSFSAANLSDADFLFTA